MDWKNVVSSVAPWIGTALGGPLGGMAVTAIADALGLSDKTEAAIKGALAGASPADLLAIKNADQAFALKMQELGFQNTQSLERIAADDRNSARVREMAVNDHTPRDLAYAITIGFFWVLALMMFNEQAQDARGATRTGRLSGHGLDEHYGVPLRINGWRQVEVRTVGKSARVTKS